MKILFLPEVRLYFQELQDILFEKEYFGFEESAVQYVRDLVFDIEEKELEGIEEKIMNISTLKVTQYNLVIYGVCNECREKHIH